MVAVLVAGFIPKQTKKRKNIEADVLKQGLFKAFTAIATALGTGCREFIYCSIKLILAGLRSVTKITVEFRGRRAKPRGTSGSPLAVRCNDGL